MLKKIFYLLIVLTIAFLFSCKTSHVVEVKPMEMTINVNVNVKVDKALDDFFDDIDEEEEAEGTNTP